MHPKIAAADLVGGGSVGAQRLGGCPMMVLGGAGGGLVPSLSPSRARTAWHLLLWVLEKGRVAFINQRALKFSGD